MSHSEWKWVEVRETNQDHKALFARINIPTGTYLGTYDGKAGVVDIGTQKQRDEIDEFFWRQSVHLRIEGTRLLYLLPTEEPNGIDFLNHSCRPNCRVDAQVFLYALRDISIGEELAADYRTFDLIPRGVRCWCNPPLCTI